MFIVKLIGFVVLWVVASHAIAWVVNGWRARQGTHINDQVSAFMMGWALGPMAVMASLSPQTNNPFKGSLALGGAIGSLVFIWLLL